MYTDFEDTNVIWGWKKRDDDFVFDTIHIDRAVAGDTDSIMLNINDFSEGLSEDEVIHLSNEVGQLTNDSFPEFCMAAFNCPEDRKGTIKTDREIVSDKSFFLSKKRYIMHVIDKEGTPKDELKIMGVELKKSDTSFAVKELLMILVNMILDGADMAEVLQRVKMMKKEFREFTPKEIAKPISVKSLKKSQDIFEMTGDMKGIPYHNRAAMFWNQIKKNTDKEIYTGEKIGVIYIKDKRSKYIGIPIDLISFPEWFEKDIIIDYDTEWKKAEKKLTNYLASMGWDIQSRKEEQRKSLFGF